MPNLNCQKVISLSIIIFLSIWYKKMIFILLKNLLKIINSELIKTRLIYKDCNLKECHTDLDKHSSPIN